ncbi:hypothetical protein [Oceanicola sp. 502str15]|uniref:hypothetical protein n=1 Tax=Oceanicola sp. 502str15 TaxID=2696061 RepID=UPI002094EFEA|nr:hypothetical protein [Oceanicola sp. 502str15]MCO6383554.1 hypothetical protein [Oceanicola sp. 502str15]
MNPIDAFSQTLKINPNAARLISAGLGVMAAAAIIISWGSNLDDLRLGAIYVLAFACVVTLLAFIARNNTMTTVLSWILVAGFGMFVLGLVGSVLRVPPSLPPTPCYLRLFFELPETCIQNLRNSENDLRIGSAAPVLPAADGGPERLWRAQEGAIPTPTDHTGEIFVQYTQPFAQADAVELSEALAELAWQVQDWKSGGEQVNEGPDTNEVRYFKDGDREAAISLAQTIHGLHPDTPIYVRDFTRLGAFSKAGRLELWLSQPLDPSA